MPDYEEQEYKKPFSLAIWARMLPFLKPYRKYLMINVALNLLMVLSDMADPFFQSYAIDHFITPVTIEGIGPFTLAYMAVVVIQAVLSFVAIRAATVVEMNVGKDLKRAQFLHLQTLSLSYFNTTPVGYIHARIMSDTSRISGILAWSLVDFLWALVYVASVFVVMFLMRPDLAAIVALVVPALALLTVYFQNHILHWNREMRKINGEITGAYNESITGVKTTKTLVTEEANAASFRALTNRMHRAGCQAAKLNAIYIPLILLCSSLSAAYVLAKGGYLVEENAMRLGTLSIFISFALEIFEPIQSMARVLAELISGQASIERIMDLLDQPAGITESEEVREKYGDTFSPKEENWEKVKGHVTFEDVSFRYPDGKEYVLEHFNLDVPAGTNVAIVGETGAGKSTLVNLVCRFFEPTKGRILMDGVDVRERSVLWLHSQIGYVLQNPHLFSGTIRDNIRYGKLSATDQEVEAAAKQVHVNEVAENLRDGYDSYVGESGALLSTGEKQLISFARAIIREPALFVLDEATSSIDTYTEQLIQKATDDILAHHTSFVVAHRLSTIRRADVILVVKDGKIIEQGTHLELLRRHGYYYRLYSKQFEEEAARKVWD